MDKGFWDNFNKSFSGLLKKIDPKSWPAFLMFVIVLCAAGGLNYIGMSPITGDAVAVAIALFFGFGVLSWHIVESRTDDSKYQEEVAEFVKWLNAGLDGVLIVLNLFRADLRGQSIGQTGLTFWDALAFGCIGISAVSHVVGFLLWTKNDPRRQLVKENERDQYLVTQKTQRATNAIQGAEARLKTLKYVADEEIRLRAEYTGFIPDDQVEKIVKNMKTNALKEFEGLQVKEQDVTKTQLVKPVQKSYQPVRQMAANVDMTELKDESKSPTKGQQS